MKHIIMLVAGLLLLNVMHAQPSTGQKAPEIMLPSVSGVVKKLSDQTGKVVLVDFWASWCAPCRKTNPALVKLYAKYRGRGFEIFGVSIDEDKTSWKRAISKDKMSWTQVRETGGWDGVTATAWKIQQIPSSFLIDKSGKIVAMDLTTNELEKKIVALLNAKI